MESALRKIMSFDFSVGKLYSQNDVLRGNVKS